MSQTPADGAQDAGLEPVPPSDVPDGGRQADPRKGDYVIDGGLGGGGKGGKK